VHGVDYRLQICVLFKLLKVKQQADLFLQALLLLSRAVPTVQGSCEFSVLLSFIRAYRKDGSDPERIFFLRSAKKTMAGQAFLL
jgi:hypothetical protein